MTEGVEKGVVAREVVAKEAAGRGVKVWRVVGKVGEDWKGEWRVVKGEAAEGEVGTEEGLGLWVTEEAEQREGGG